MAGKCRDRSQTPSLSAQNLARTSSREFPTAPVSEGLPTLAVKTLPSTAGFNQEEPCLIARLSKVVGDDTTAQRARPASERHPKLKPMRGANPAYVNDVAGASVRLAEANLNEIYHVAGPVAMSSFDLKVMLKKAFHAAYPGGCSWIREISVSKEASLGYFAVVCETQATIAWPVRSLRRVREIARRKTLRPRILARIATTCNEGNDKP
jgi:hypothetical protein